MKREIIDTACPVLQDFLMYCETIKGKSPNTVDQYFIDLTLFLKHLKLTRGLCNADEDISEIDVSDVDMGLIKTVTMRDIYSFLVYCKEDRGNNTATRARKTSALKSFFKYLCSVLHSIDVNPAADIGSPKLKKSLPVYLTLDQSIDLLKAVDGPNKERDYCILTLFLNCGMRLSELCSLNYTDIKPDGSMKITGKGNKERIIYLNQACISAVEQYMKVRPADGVKMTDKNALFLSSRRRRICNKTVQHLVYAFLDKAGLGGQGYSVHKLRHTAATLMYQQGGVDIRVLKDILGHENLGTTQIYTHVSDRQVEEAFNKNPLAGIKAESKK